MSRGLYGLALCSGIGGLELGLRLVVPGYRCVGHVERDAYAAAVLVARMADAALDPAPAWDDLATFDGVPWRGCVDIVTSGLPCQPYSLAGKRGGNADERALWPELVRIVRECEPGLVFIENVPAFLTSALGVYAALRRMGFEWAPPLLATASNFGAPHIRKRVFLLAAHPERAELWDQLRGCGGPDRPGPTGPGDDRADAADGRGDGPADGDGDGRAGEWRGWVFDIERQTLRHDADRCSDRCRICGSPWAAESPPVRVADVTPDRVERLRTLGNGVVPLVAARAFAALVKELS